MIRFSTLRELNSYDKIATIEPNTLLTNVLGVNSIEEFKFSYESDRFVNSLVDYVLDMQSIKPDFCLIFTQELKKLIIVINRGSVDLITLMQLNIKLYKLISSFIIEFDNNIQSDIGVLEKIKVEAVELFREILLFMLMSFEIVEFIAFIWLLKHFSQSCGNKSLNVMENELKNLLGFLFHFSIN